MTEDQVNRLLRELLVQYGREMVEDMTRLLDHLQIPATHVVGYSMGGYLTGRMIARHPERVITATFGASSPMSPRLGAIEYGTLQKELADSLERGTGLRPALARNFPSPPPEEQLAQINTNATGTTTRSIKRCRQRSSTRSGSPIS